VTLVAILEEVEVAAEQRRGEALPQRAIQFLGKPFVQIAVVVRPGKPIGDGVDFGPAQADGLPHHAPLVERKALPDPLGVLVPFDQAGRADELATFDHEHVAVGETTTLAQAARCRGDHDVQLQRGRELETLIGHQLEPPGLRWQRRPLNEPARRSVFGLTPSRRAASATRIQPPARPVRRCRSSPPRAAGLIGTISSELDQFCREEVGFWQVRSATGRIAPRPRPPWLAPGRTRRPGR